MLCCCDDEDDWITDTSSGTAVVSDLADEEPKKSASKGSHGNRKWRFWPESKKAREHYAEGTRNEADSIENVAKVQPVAPPGLRNGVGDNGWLPVAGETRSSVTVVLDFKENNMKEHGVHRTRSSPIDFCSSA